MSRFLADYWIQVLGGLTVSFILGWVAKTISLKQNTGDNSQSAQAQRGAAAIRDGVGVGNVHAESGGNITQHIGDRHYGNAETEDSRASRRVYVLATGIVMRTAGTIYGGSRSMPGGLWPSITGWHRKVELIGTFDSHGKFHPRIPPGEFNGNEGSEVSVSRDILQWYLTAPEQCRDFDMVRTFYELPTIDEVRSVLGATR